jgi:CHAT domain-containing protein/tetratricopeptide (TPR) repeat protein
MAVGLTARAGFAALVLAVSTPAVRGVAARDDLATSEPAAPAPADLEVELESARRLVANGRLADARVEARRLQARAEAEHGTDSLEAAAALDILIETFRRGGTAGELHARALAERAISIKEKALGPDHPDLAKSVHALGNLLYLGAHDHAGARALYERALAIREKALGTEHVLVAHSLNNLASMLRAMGDYAAARPLYERVVAIDEKVLGPDHPDLAAHLGNLARLLRETGDYSAARPLTERSITISEKALGPDNIYVARGLADLAGLLRTTGDYAAARPLYERALAISEKALGSEHAEVALCLNNLAELHFDTGDHATARPLLERAVAILVKTQGADHPWVAAVLNNLGGLLYTMRDHAAARPLLERALAITEGGLGSDHPNVAASLDNLAQRLADTGDVVAARGFQERALAIREKALGPHHPVVAGSLNNLANLLSAMGDHAAARLLHERALAIREKALGPDHPDVALSLNNLALVLRSLGQTRASLDAALRAEAIGREHFHLTARSLAERETLRYAAARRSGLDLALSLATAGLDAGDRARTWDAALRSRALVLDEIAARHRTVAEAALVGRRAQDVAAASQRLANLTVRGPGDQPPERYRKLLDEARQDAERAERALADQSSSFGEERSRARLGLADIAAALKPGAALVAFFRHERWERGATRPMPSYIAFVLRGGASEPVAVPLGPAEELDSLVARWREDVTRPPASTTLPPPTAGSDALPAPSAESSPGAGAALRRQAWDPLLPHLDDARRVVVVPDGALHLVSFAALPADGGGFVVESGPLVHYLSAERDLVPARRPTPTGEGALVLGGAAFDEASLFAALARPRAAPPKEGIIATIAGLLGFRGQHSTCAGFRDLRFAPLPGAEQEAREVASRWGEARLPTAADGGVVHLSGASANEAAFKAQAPGRRVLHLATHGFFLGGSCESALDTSRGLERAARMDERPLPVTGENPLLLSGLALAGANHRDAAGHDEEDGILTAEEIASLDLSRCEWAVLSACDTGLGDIRAGEGVFGLRRAFQVAGTKTVIMSLWAVDDESTRQWMKGLYDARLGQRLDTAECVREASVAMVRERRAKGLDDSPLAWGAFVAAGDWR